MNVLQLSFISFYQNISKQCIIPIDVINPLLLFPNFRHVLLKKKKKNSKAFFFG